MIILDATTMSLEAVLAGAVTTNQLPIAVSYTDHSTSTWGMSGAATPTTVTNDTTDVEIAAAPGSDTVRKIKYMSVWNEDTVDAEVIIKLNDNGTDRELISITLSSGESLIYTESQGFYKLAESSITNFKGWVEVAQATISNDATVEFDQTELFDGTYKTIKFVIESVIPVTDNVVFQLLIAVGGGGFATSNYDYHITAGTSGSTSYIATAANGEANIDILIGVGDSTDECVSGEVTIYDPSNADCVKIIHVEAAARNAQALLETSRGHGFYDGDDAALSGVLFSMSSGNIESGRITAYGVLA